MNNEVTIQWRSDNSPADDEFHQGIIVSELNGQLAALYHANGAAEIAVVEPTATVGIYAIVGAGLALESCETLPVLAVRLRNMTTLDYLAFTLAASVDAPPMVPTEVVE
ncbi:hypothetical protein [Paenibacillus sp. FSL M7-0420]|uniref:hypothetical protein n=1 Tax=Paenibacillus sp. FSL M7-0420 TaxID=2921609 RepID=UPI0030FB52C2